MALLLLDAEILAEELPMGWLASKVLPRGVKIHARELDEMVARLAAVDGDELALTVIFATVLRHQWMKRGYDLLCPAACLAQNPTLPAIISTRITHLQRAGKPALAEGNMVWLHTLRAMDDVDLHDSGRAMWAELSRGFPRVEGVAATWFQAGAVDLGGYDRIPDGLGGRR